LFPEGIELFGFGVELGFVELREMEAVGFGFCSAKVRASGRIALLRDSQSARRRCGGTESKQRENRREIPHFADSVRNDE
jgi:hypothetical protein